MSNWTRNSWVLKSKTSCSGRYVEFLFVFIDIIEIIKLKYADICENEMTLIENKLNNEEYSDFYEFSSDLMKFKEFF